MEEPLDELSELDYEDEEAAAFAEEEDAASAYLLLDDAAFLHFLLHFELEPALEEPLSLELLDEDYFLLYDS